MQRSGLCTCDCEEGTYAHSGGAYFGGPQPLLPGVAVLLGIPGLTWQQHLNNACYRFCYSHAHIELQGTA